MLRSMLLKYRHAIGVCLGLVAVGTWMNLIGYSKTFVPPTISANELANFGITRYCFYSGVVLCCGAFIALGERLSPFFKARAIQLGVVFGAVMCVATLCFAFSYDQALVPSLPLAAAACFVTGVCYNLFVFLFYVHLARNENTKICIISISVSLIGEMVLGDVFSVTFDKLEHTVIGALMPLLAGGLMVALQKSKPGTPVAVPQLRGRERSYHISLIFVVSFGSIAVIAARTAGLTAGLWGTRNDLISPAAFNVLALVSITAIFLLLMWLTILRRIDDQISVRFQLPLVAIIAGCILLLINEVVLPHTAYPVEAIVINAIGLFAHLFSWVVLISFIKSVSFSVFRIMGLSGLFFNVLALAWVTFFEGNNQLISAVILLIVFLIVVGITALPLGLNRVAKVGEDTLLKRIATDFKLSNRETEIFILLAQGRSRPYIQQQLYLAEGTVKTHSTHIYTKLGVHSRQEMFDLIAAERERS